MNTNELPALPEPATLVTESDVGYRCYTAFQMREFARQALADRERQAGEAVAWKPIETAPQDGEFLVYMPNERAKIQAARWHPNVKTIGGNFHFDLTAPTHWMPLPAAPSPDGKAEPAQWIDDPHDIEQGQMLNPEWLKLNGWPPKQLAEAMGAQPSPAPKAEQAEAPSGMVPVPKRMTQAMRDVTDTEGWTWEDLLAAAEAITKAEYADLATQPTATTASNAGEREALQQALYALEWHASNYCEDSMPEDTVSAIGALRAALASKPPADNWQQYAKEGETAQACIERHRSEQDGLMNLLKQARNVPPAGEQKPVASIYVTPGGEREFDDWKCALPVGRNLLYPGPQPEQVAQDREDAERWRALESLPRAMVCRILERPELALRHKPAGPYTLTEEVDAIRAARARGDGGAV